MRDLAQFFSYLNDVDFKYVVLRNWENLPHNVEVGPHSDLDLLVYDQDHFLEIFPQLERVYPHPRVQFKLHLDSGDYVQMDVRYVGDDYYPGKFEENIINTREWNSAGFFTPNPLHHRIALAYHAVHHKGNNTYQKYLGDVSIGKLLESLKKNSEFKWVEPEDPSVGRFNAYLKGGTAIVEGNGSHITKKQYRYKGYDLIANERRILKMLDSQHFPKLLNDSDKELKIEHCGAELTHENLPENWKEQFVEILEELDRVGVVHRDIRLENFMVKDGVIRLVDFGWARLSSEDDGRHPDLLGYPNKCPFGFNDRYSMNRIVKQLTCELEELACVS